jgi:DNA repair exonuclease SbcCD ATPase subunit
MSIEFKYVKFKNILSTGNNFTTINLNANKSTLIIGENGAGKSTMLDAISFGLYGKAFRRISKPQLLNSINQKALEVELAFSIGQIDYVIKRGIKPNIFEIWKNDELLNQDAAARDYQAYLEQSILKMNFKSFGQIVVLGSSTFVPFMQLPAQHRREVIEDLLDIQIFSVMNNLLKDKVTHNKTEFQENKYQIDLIRDRVMSAKDHNESIRAMKSIEVSRIKEKVKEQLDYIATEEESIEEVSNSLDNLMASMIDKKDATKKFDELNDVDRKLDTKKIQLIKEIHFYENHDNCPTCKQGIEPEFKHETLQSHAKKSEEIEDAKRSIGEKRLLVEKRLLEIYNIEAEISAANLKAGEHRANIKLSKSILGGFKKELGDAEKEVEEVDNTKISELETELREQHDKQSQLSSDRETLSIVGSMLKDGGIKTRIIKQYVPVMNKLINKYLSAMDFFVQFELDEAFDETIKSRFRDVFSYGSFSEGEKLRIDLALLFTWRAISKLRNSVSTNLLIMDEIMDSSLDNAGTEEFLKIINELTSDSNVFIISHKGDQLYDKFDNTIRFQKHKNFSRIVE